MVVALDEKTWRQLRCGKRCLSSNRFQWQLVRQSTRIISHERGSLGCSEYEEVNDNSTRVRVVANNRDAVVCIQQKVGSEEKRGGGMKARKVNTRRVQLRVLREATKEECSPNRRPLMIGPYHVQAR